MSIKKIKNISLTTLLRTSTVDSRIPKHKTAKIQRHSIALKVVPFDTITKSDNQYKTTNNIKYILLGNPWHTRIGRMLRRSARQGGPCSYPNIFARSEL